MNISSPFRQKLIFKAVILPVIFFQAAPSIFGWDMIKDFAIDQNDALPATRIAIEKAKAHFGSKGKVNDVITLHFPAGEYHFKGTGWVFEIDRICPGPEGRLIIEGEGPDKTRFVIHNNQNPNSKVPPGGKGKGNLKKKMNLGGFMGKKCCNITFQNFEITTSKLTVTQGDVVALGRHWIDIEIHPGFPSPVELNQDVVNNARWMRKYSNDIGEPMVIEEGNKQLAWSRVEKLEENVYRFHFLSKRPLSKRTDVSYQAGDVMGIKVKHGSDMYRFIDGQDLIVRNIRVLRKTRGIFKNCTNLLIDGFSVSRDIVEGRKACLSSPDGGPQIVRDGESPQNAIVRNCHIVGTGDDCIAFFGINQGLVSDNYVQDSFARGILLDNSKIKLGENEAIRAPIENQDHFKP